MILWHIAHYSCMSRFGVVFLFFFCLCAADRRMGLLAADEDYGFIFKMKNDRSQ